MTKNSDDSRRENSSRTSSDGSQRFDDLFTALANTRRRRILHYLQNEGQASRSDIVQQLVAWKYDIPPNKVSDETIDKLEIELAHRHLPKLHDLHLIEYDKRSNEVVFRDPPELVEHCLEHCASQDLPD